MNGSVDATSYGLNPGVETDAFTQALDERGQSQEMRDEATRLQERWAQMDASAVNWKLHWQRAYEFIVPRKEDVIASRMAGDDRESDIYDTTPILANEQLAAALHSMLTNPELRFFEILFGDPKLDQLPQVKEWCEDCADKMYQVLNSSNFQTEIHEAYIDLGAAGTACLYIEENPDFVVHFSTRALKEIRIDENYLGQVDTIARIFKLRPQQILKMFPELKEADLKNALQTSADGNATDQIQILHMVEPMDAVQHAGHRAAIKAKGHSVSSTYMLYDKKYIIRQSSYYEFPYAAPRWSKTTGELYGRGPGFSMLPDIMMLNAMMLTVIQGAQKTVDPPLMVEDDTVIGQVRLTPAGLTVIRAGAKPPTPLITNARIDFGQKMLEDVRKRIRAGFYLDQLQLPQESPQRTAGEVRQIAEEQLRLMGPVLGRQHFELLRPLITRLWGIMSRRDMFKKPPGEVGNRKFQVRYSSLLARAQRLQEMQNVQRAIMTIQPLAQIQPNVIDNVKMDDLIKEILTGYGVPSRLIPTDQELRKVRAQQKQDKQQAQQAAQQLNQSQVAKNAAPLAQQMAANKQPQNPISPQEAFAGGGRGRRGSSTRSLSYVYREASGRGGQTESFRRPAPAGYRLQAVFRN